MWREKEERGRGRGTEREREGRRDQERKREREIVGNATGFDVLRDLHRVGSELQGQEENVCLALIAEAHPHAGLRDVVAREDDSTRDQSWLWWWECGGTEKKSDARHIR